MQKLSGNIVCAGTLMLALGLGCNTRPKPDNGYATAPQAVMNIQNSKEETKEPVEDNGVGGGETGKNKEKDSIDTIIEEEPPLFWMDTDGYGLSVENKTKRFSYHKHKDGTASLHLKVLPSFSFEVYLTDKNGDNLIDKIVADDNIYDDGYEYKSRDEAQFDRGKDVSADILIIQERFCKADRIWKIYTERLKESIRKAEERFAEFKKNYKPREPLDAFCD